MELKRDEILKWWELCANDITCRKCPYEKVANCQSELMQATLDIFKELTEEKSNLEYTLMGVMHSVDKWLEGVELEQDEVNRAATMREKTLQIVEKLTEENERLRGCVKSKEEVEAIMRATYEPLVKEITKEQADKAVADAVRKMQEMLKAIAYYKVDATVKDRVFVVSVDDINQIAKEMIENNNE